jgi:hypothetical protein
MSEFQNKTIRLLTVCEGEASVTDPAQRRRNLLSSTLELYRALGGSFEELESAIMKEETGTLRRLDLIVGDLMKELAAICHIYDMDIMQAGHNTLDKLIYEERSFPTTEMDRSI